MLCAALRRSEIIIGHVVDQWCAHMRSKGCRRVLCLLTDGELGFYGEPLLPHLKRHFPDDAEGAEGSAAATERVQRIEPHAENALAGVTACLEAATTAQEPVVCFCSTGQARTGMVLAFWLHRKYSLPVAAAVTEVIEHAAGRGAMRKPSVEQVMQFAVGPAARSLLPSMKATAGPLAFGTPRVDDRLHVTFLQTGGTIDKDYPRLTGGYAFEITDPAVGRVLRHAAPVGFTHDVLSVCRKDSQEVTVEDRQALVESIRRTNSDKFVVTHGTDTIVETAQYVAAARGELKGTAATSGRKWCALAP